MLLLRILFLRDREDGRAVRQGLLEPSFALHLGLEGEQVRVDR
jgi:hypothetical protein